MCITVSKNLSLDKISKRGAFRDSDHHVLRSVSKLKVVSQQRKLEIYESKKQY